MLNALLPLIEALGGQGAATSLGAGSGVGSTLGRLLGGSSVQAFGSQQELGGAMRQISDLTTNLAAARDAMTAMRDEHQALGEKAAEDERLYGFRDPVEAQRMADISRQQIENARQSQLQQQQMQDLQARAAVTMDPALQAQQQRQTRFQRAGALGIGGQIVESAGPSFLKNLPGVQPAAELLGFGMGQSNAQIAGGMANAATTGVSSVVGGAMKGASVGSMAGPIGAGVGALAGGLGAASVELARLPGRIVDWSEALLASQRTISRFSGVMAQADAQRDVRKLQRDFASAGNTGGSTADLSHSMDDLYDVLRPLKDTVTIVIAQELNLLVRGITAMAPAIVVLAGVAAKAGDMMTGGMMGFQDQFLLALGKVIADEADRQRRKTQLGQGAAAAIDRFKKEDPAKPRQAPRM